jgi:glycosyltransferase involved in cell wall biosynthesis
LSPNPISLDLVDTAMIHTVWDLGHRDVPEYPEITGDRHYEEREYFYSRMLPKSFRVVVDTPHTASRIADIYKVSLDRIIVGGLSPARKKVTSSTENNSLVKSLDQFFLYPAQFWPHKRHVLLTEAFSQFLKSHPSVNLVFTGSDKGNMSHIKDLVNKLGIQKNVHFLGFVSDELLTELMENTVSPCFHASSDLQTFRHLKQLNWEREVSLVIFITTQHLTIH